MEGRGRSRPDSQISLRTEIFRTELAVLFTRSWASGVFGTQDHFTTRSPNPGAAILGSFHQPYHPASLYSIEREKDVVPIEHGKKMFHRSVAWSRKLVQRPRCTDFIKTHQPAVAGDVRRQDGREPSLNAFRNQVAARRTSLSAIQDD
jgi:hypothetical protein